MSNIYILSAKQHFKIPQHIIDTLLDDERLKPIQREIYLRLLKKLTTYNADNNICQNYVPTTIEEVMSWLNLNKKSVREHINILFKLEYLKKEGYPTLIKDRLVLSGVVFQHEVFPNIDVVGEGSAIEETQEVKVKEPSAIESHEQSNKGSSNDVSIKTEKESPEDFLNRVNQNPFTQKFSTDGNNLPSKTEEKFSQGGNKSSHIDQIIRSDKDQIPKGLVDDLIKSSDLFFLTELSKKRDSEKISLKQLRYILRRFLSCGAFLSANKQLEKTNLLNTLVEMQKRMNIPNYWKTDNLDQRLNAIQNGQFKKITKNKLLAA